MSSPLISLCMIVKDEADVIARCLESAAKAVDEIIVVDTGSIDSTAEIARSLGAIVINSEWRNDFAYARNAGLQHASGKWILVLDADEELDMAAGDKLRQYVVQDGADGYFVHIYNFAGERNDGPAVINPTIRMFRNHPRHRFEGRIHEQITPSIQASNPNAVFMLTDVRVNHYGYQNEVIQRKNKTERNLLLLQETLKEKPDDPFHLYNISVEWLRLGKVREALEGFRKSRMLTNPKTSYAHLLYKCEAKCHMALGQSISGLDVCAEGLLKYPQYSDLYHYQGLFHLNMSDIGKAKEAFSKAVETGPPSSGYHTEEGMGSYISAYQLGLLHEASLEIEAAAESYLRAVQSFSTFVPPLYRLFHLLRISGREADIVPLLLERISIDEPEQAVNILKVMEDTGCSHAALRFIERYRHLLSPVDATVYTAAHALLIGDLIKARILVQQLQVSNPEHQGLLRMNVLLCSLGDELEEAQRHWNRLTELYPEQQSSVLAYLIGDLAPAGLLLDQEGLHDMRMAIKSAFSNSRPIAVNRIASAWGEAVTVQDSPNRANATAALVRTLAEFAERHLERLTETPRLRELSNACRLVLPFEDGSLR
ncbi:tetratricopeptide repeat-containing glycosyltransferase family 2 protein [Paenibacillus prosopidis]|uniref:Glycosyl transferase family 2 n=1 Tax=Paenibacillus prosopidis TaxID=630520 RepID=A0A368W2Z7_9BACL|nr:glycosyltransferase family 2 protein [Paenibacillus prosopidis]RCW49530.1 glycosyl transferase family 2 [Paenibacillus prosopidis]